MTKIEVISQKPSKQDFWQKLPFLTLFGQKNPTFWVFQKVPLLTHASRHLGEDFRKISLETNETI